MRKFGLYAVAGALALALPAAAQAVPIIDFNGTSGAFKNTDITGDFDDTFRFTVADDGIVGSTITSIAVSILTDVNFTSVSLNGVEFTNLLSGTTEFRSLEALPVDSGEQVLRVQGNSGGNGAYSGTIAFVAQQVPEPAGWTTLVVALGIFGVGLKLSRRTRSDRPATA